MAQAVKTQKRERKTTDSNGMPKDFDVAASPKISLEFGTAWFAVERHEDRMPNLPTPTYQTGNKIYLQHTAENVAWMLKYNNVLNRQAVEQNWINTYRQGDNADRLQLMQQCKANEEAVVPELRKRLAAGGFECWDWLRSHQALCVYFGLLNNSFGLLLDMGCGKAAPLSSLVYTPTGPKTMGEMCVGDIVCTPDGKTGSVLGVYPQGIRPVYELTFTDGTKVRCDIEHLWNVQTPVQKYRGQGFVTKSVRELLGDLKQGSNTKWFIPVTKPMHFETSPLPLHPYLLGALLGDGGLTTGYAHITKGNPDVINKVRVLLPKGHWLQPVKDGAITYRIKAENTNVVDQTIRRLGLVKRSIEKHIPAEYLYNSVENRVNLLQGLMDTDGTVARHQNKGKTACAQYSTSSPYLARDVAFLVQSLGGIVVTSVKKAPKYKHKGETRTGQPNYVLHFNLPPDLVPSSSPDNASLYRPPVKYFPRRGILSIDYVGDEPTQCISIDHPEHLYITDNCAVTHNTLTSLQIAANRLRRRETEAVLLVIPATLYNTWQTEIDQLRGMYNDPIYNLVQLSGAAEERRYQLKHCRGPFFAVNYEMLHTLLPELSAKQFNMLIFDESSKIKSPDAKMTQVSWYMAQRSRYKLILNGTPYSSSIQDLHSQLNVLQCGSLYKPLPSDPYAFRGKYMQRGHSGFTWEPKRGSVEIVNRALYSYSVRYMSEECLELPERTIQQVFCDMTPKQWEVYREVEAQAFTEVQDSVVKAENKLTTLAKVFQITSGFVNDVNGKPVLFEPKAPKIEALREMLASTDKSIIVFAWHSFILEMLHEEYKADSALYYGSMSASDKTQAENLFKAGKKRILFGQEMAAGRGLNLQIAPYSIFLERNHSLDNYTQALKRNHRDGQKSHCFAYLLMVKNTVDTDIQDVLDAKASDSDVALATIQRNMARRLGR